MSCIIVLGCYRSGTSAIAGILSKLGVHMGDQFDPPNKNNPSGYWEDLAFKNIHKKFENSDDPKIIIEYLNLIEKRENSHNLWGVKDPLLCVNLMKLVKNIRKDYKLIICRRNTDAVALSMSKALKEKKYPMKFLPLVEFYIQQMNNQIQQYRGPILEMDHDETLKNPEFHISRIANFIGVPNQKKLTNFILNNKNVK